jgi:RNA polymerase sigma-70 factor (ECF subfamily)
LFAEPLYNEKELLVLIGTGDEAAFTKLFNHYHNRIYTIACKLSGSSIIAEEIVQDVLLKIWLKRNDLDHVQNFSAYLYVIIQNTVYKALRRIARNYKDSLDAGTTVKEQFAWDADPEIYLIDKEYHSLLQKGIEELPNQQRQVYKLIRERGLKRAEVADLLNLQPETVKFHLSKAMKNLWSFCQLHLHLFIGFTLTVFLPALFAFVKT